MSVSSTAEANITLGTNPTLTKENSLQRKGKDPLQLPVSASDIHPSPLPGDRPITASTFEISDTVNILGIRPIAASELQVSDTINLLGIRPIAASKLQVSKTITTSGIRPIASNKIEKIDELIGYLD
ncbi:hypothetical protein IQ230_01155 [Gloeocapsopsis crepidinum LEGE 06123]|uniref:Uncharacterized protein n=1 Tax=Gloeocapsopsis crepidinum LEGE 06123 TaxID=588587 RepID=A0ABR9UL36_9CHRO|nr:hypothetical protein [Gloeocapsopsis crepidinum]MBE9188996.1 hypothetical protein [Gloeocapsopsis crepidinum LEGE 06123]